MEDSEVFEVGANNMSAEEFWSELLDTPEMRKQYEEWCKLEAFKYAYLTMARALINAMKPKDKE